MSCSPRGRALRNRVVRAGLIAALTLGWTAADAMAQAATQFFPYYGKNRVKYDDFQWHIYTTDHFEIFYYPEVEEHLERIASYAESAYAQISADLTHDLANLVPLVIFKTHSEFEQQNIIPGAVSDGVAAFAEPFRQRIVLPIDEPPDQLYRLIAHELTHQRVRVRHHPALGHPARHPAVGRRGARRLPGRRVAPPRPDDGPRRRPLGHPAGDEQLPGLRPQREPRGSSTTSGTPPSSSSRTAGAWPGVREFLFSLRKSVIGGEERRLRGRVQHPRRGVRRRVLVLHPAPLPGLPRQGTARRLRPRPRPRPLRDAVPGRLLDRAVAVRRPPRRLRGQPQGPGRSTSSCCRPRDGEVVSNLTEGFNQDLGYESIQLPGARWNAVPWMSWSPVDDRLAYFVRKGKYRSLMLQNVVTRETEELIDLEMVDAPESPDFSPDGRYVAFSALQNAVGDIYLLDLETREVTNLTQDDFADYAPTFSPDGSYLVYVARISGNNKLFKLDLETREKTQLTFGTFSEASAQFLDENTPRVLVDRDRSAGPGRPGRGRQRRHLQRVDARPEQRRAPPVHRHRDRQRLDHRPARRLPAAHRLRHLFQGRVTASTPSSAKSRCTPRSRRTSAPPAPTSTSRRR